MRTVLAVTVVAILGVGAVAGHDHSDMKVFWRGTSPRGWTGRTPGRRPMK